MRGRLRLQPDGRGRRQRDLRRDDLHGGSDLRLSLLRRRADGRERVQAGAAVLRGREHGHLHAVRWRCDLQRPFRELHGDAGRTNAQLRLRVSLGPGSWSGLDCASYSTGLDCVGVALDSSEFHKVAKGCSGAFGATDYGYDCTNYNPGYTVRLACY